MLSGDVYTRSHNVDLGLGDFFALGVARNTLCMADTTGLPYGEKKPRKEHDDEQEADVT